MFKNDKFFADDSNLQPLQECIKKYKTKTLDLSKCKVSEVSAKRILKAYSKLENLESITMFKQDSFFSDEDNLEEFLSFIERQTHL